MLSFVECEGSEVKESFTDGCGSRAMQMRHHALSQLRRCTEMRERNGPGTRIPLRDSKLTFVLSPALREQGKVCLLVACGQCTKHRDRRGQRLMGGGVQSTVHDLQLTCRCGAAGRNRLTLRAAEEGAAEEEEAAAAMEAEQEDAAARAAE